MKPGGLRRTTEDGRNNMRAIMDAGEPRSPARQPGDHSSSFFPLWRNALAPMMVITLPGGTSQLGAPQHQAAPRSASGRKSPAEGWPAVHPFGVSSVARQRLSLKILADQERRRLQYLDLVQGVKCEIGGECSQFGFTCARRQLNQFVRH